MKYYTERCIEEQTEKKSKQTKQNKTQKRKKEKNAEEKTAIEVLHKKTLRRTLVKLISNSVNVY